MFWLPLLLGLAGGGVLGGALGSTLGGGGDLGSLIGLDLFGKTYEEGSGQDSGGGGLLGWLGAGTGALALLLMVMSMNTQKRDQQQPTIIFVDGDDDE